MMCGVEKHHVEDMVNETLARAVGYVHPMIGNPERSDSPWTWTVPKEGLEGLAPTKMRRNWGYNDTGTV